MMVQGCVAVCLTKHPETGALMGRVHFHREDGSCVESGQQIELQAGNTLHFGPVCVCYETDAGVSYEPSAMDKHAPKAVKDTVPTKTPAPPPAKK